MQFIVSTHAPEVINSISKESVIVIENNQVFSAPTETYGRDANGILRSIMHVNERPQEVMEKFDEFYHAVDRKDYVKAEEILYVLEDRIGEDPELVSMHVQLDLEQF